MRGKEWQIEGDLVLKEGKVYMLKDKILRVEKNYWWPGVMKDIEKYIEGCDMYQRIKNKMKILAEKLKLSEVLEKP